MNIQTIKDFCHNLVSSDIPIFLFQSNIVPDNIIRIVQIFSFQVFCFQTKCREMVSVEYDHCRFPSLLDCIDQLSNKFVHLMDFIYIVLPCISLAFIFHSGYIDLRIFQGRLCRIISMSLHTDCTYKICSVCCVQRLHDVRNKNIVCRPSLRSRL